MMEICEQITYQFFEQGETILNFNQHCEEMYIILDGAVDFTVDTAKNRIQDKFIIDIAKDLTINPQTLIQEFNDFKNKKSAKQSH